MKPLRALVVGLGAMGRHHVRVVRETDGVDLVGVVDIDLAARDRISRHVGVRSFARVEDALNARPEIAIVATPTSAHFHAAVPLLDAGVHVLVEKPIAATPDEGAFLVSLARDRGAILAVGHVERFNPVIAELVARVEAGEIGRLFHVHARRIGPFPPRISDVGILVDLATHDLDLFGLLCGGQPVRIAAEVRRLRGMPHEDLASALLAYPNGVVCVLDVNWLTPSKLRQFSVTGEAGVLAADLLNQNLDLHRVGSAAGVARLPVVREEPLRLQLRDFIGAIRDSRSPTVSGATALATLELAYRLTALRPGERVTSATPNTLCCD